MLDIQDILSVNKFLNAKNNMKKIQKNIHSLNIIIAIIICLFSFYATLYTQEGSRLYITLPFIIFMSFVLKDFLKNAINEKIYSKSLYIKETSKHKTYLDFLYSSLCEIKDIDKPLLKKEENKLIELSNLGTEAEKHDFYTFLVREFDFKKGAIYNELQIMNKKYGICL